MLRKTFNTTRRLYFIKSLGKTSFFSTPNIISNLFLTDRRIITPGYPSNNIVQLNQNFHSFYFFFSFLV